MADNEVVNDKENLSKEGKQETEGGLEMKEKEVKAETIVPTDTGGHLGTTIAPGANTTVTQEGSEEGCVDLKICQLFHPDPMNLKVHNEEIATYVERIAQTGLNSPITVLKAEGLCGKDNYYVPGNEEWKMIMAAKIIGLADILCRISSWSEEAELAFYKLGLFSSMRLYSISDTCDLKRLLDFYEIDFSELPSYGLADLGNILVIGGINEIKK